MNDPKLEGISKAPNIFETIFTLTYYVATKETFLCSFSQMIFFNESMTC